jgi:hypothetical protein
MSIEQRTVVGNRLVFDELEPAKQSLLRFIEHSRTKGRRFVVAVRFSKDFTGHAFSFQTSSSVQELLFTVDAANDNAGVFTVDAEVADGFNRRMT